MKSLKKIQEELNEAKFEIRWKMLDLFVQGTISDDDRKFFLSYLDSIQKNINDIEVLRCGPWEGEEK